MASSDNLASIEQWTFRAPFAADSWFSEAFASRDTETLTKALQKSLSSNNTNSETLTSDSISPFLDLVKPETASPTPTPTVSNVSGSDPETAPKRQRNAIPAAGSGKVSKRKSRASKRSQTTFITADPANFRQMVQQVTGIRFGNSQMSMAPILKPEPHRPGNRLPPGGGGGGGCLPTLDTSAFLLDHHQQNVMVGPTTSGSGPVTGSLIGSGPLSFQSSSVVPDSSSGVGFDFDTLASFPTLESWKVM